MDEQPEMKNINLDDALQMFADQNQEPDGFLMRLVVFDGDDVDISPLTVSVEGLCMTHDLQYLSHMSAFPKSQKELYQMAGLNS